MIGPPLPLGLGAFIPTYKYLVGRMDTGTSASVDFCTYIRNVLNTRVRLHPFSVIACPRSVQHFHAVR
jgi:hypothetical protein